METIVGGQQEDLNRLIRHYYNLSPGYTLKEMCRILNTVHGVGISARRIKYIIKKEGFSRLKVSWEHF